MRARGLDSMPIVTSDRHLVVATGAGGAEAAEGGTRYKCYILPPIKYPDGEHHAGLGLLLVVALQISGFPTRYLEPVSTVGWPYTECYSCMRRSISHFKTHLERNWLNSFCPSGHVYMKLGIQYQATTALRVPLLSPHEMALWYRGAHPRCAHVNTLLGDAMRAHFPGASKHFSCRGETPFVSQIYGRQVARGVNET